MEDTHIIQTSQIIKFIEKLETLLMYRETGNGGDNDAFFENLNILEDEFAYFIYPLIIPDPICTFSYLCNVLLNFNTLGLKKSSFVFLDAKLPAMPRFVEGKRDIRLVFKNCVTFLNGLNLENYLNHTSNYILSENYQNFLKNNFQYSKLISKIHSFNIKKEFLRTKSKKLGKKLKKQKNQEFTNIIINSCLNKEQINENLECDKLVPYPIRDKIRFRLRL